MEEAYKTVVYIILYQIVYSTISRRTVLYKIISYRQTLCLPRRLEQESGKVGKPRTTFFSLTERTIYFLIRLQILYLKCLYFVLTWY